MSKEKEFTKNFKNLQGENCFIFLCVLLEVCLIGIVWKLVLGRTDYWEVIVTAIVPSIFGTIGGLLFKRNDDETFKEIKLFNPFRKRVLGNLIAISVLLSVLTIFVMGVVFDMQWRIVGLTSIVTTWVASWVAYVLSPIWNS